MKGHGVTSLSRATPLEDVHVIGVDPGKTTGMARLYAGILTAVAVPAAEVDRVLSAWLADIIPAVVGCERYIINQRTARLSRQPEAIETTGVVRALVERSDRAVMIDQNMSDAKRFIGKELRAALGWQQRGPLAVHMNDAACQVGKALYARYPAAFRQLVDPYIN